MADKEEEIEFKEDPALIEFEDEIRTASIPLETALEMKAGLEDVFIVGGKIYEYLPAFRELGFQDCWQVIMDEGKYYKYLYDNGKPFSSEILLMYFYIDTVLRDTTGHIMVFLQPTSIEIAKGLSQVFVNGELQEESYNWTGATFNELERIFHLFPEYYERIHFVTGLYDHSPEEFLKLTANY